MQVSCVSVCMYCTVCLAVCVFLMLDEYSDRQYPDSFQGPS